jgi:hypothetical protein
LAYKYYSRKTFGKRPEFGRCPELGYFTVASGTAVVAVNKYEAEASGDEVEVVVTAPEWV